MAKFLTPPEWYDQNGNLNKMLNCASGANSVSLMAGDDNSGTDSVAIGQYSGSAGDKNVAVGYGSFIEGGSNTVVVGAGINVSGSNNVFVGSYSGGGTTEATISNSIAIGSDATVDANQQIQIGNNTLDYDVRFGKTKLIQPLGTETKSFTLSNSRIGFSGNPSADFAAFDISISNYQHYVIFSYQSNRATTPMWLGISNKIRVITITRDSDGTYSGVSFSNSLTIDSGNISFSGWLEEATEATVTAHYYKGVE